MEKNSDRKRPSYFQERKYRRFSVRYPAMAVPEHHIVGAVQLVGEGEVVRVESHQSGIGFAIAVKCRRPLSKLEDYLPTSVN